MKTYIKIFFAIICMFNFGYNYSQTLESIKKSDTVYIYFDNGNFQKIKNADINNEIKFDDENFVNFSERKYLDFESIEFNKEMSNKTVKKYF